ncbi:transcriptional regulator, TetR family [Lentzea xinjiangensis]|uniref:Transcriptional regulator, TetR family n=1 Tax=Lentzea xinjiangensis TaxID=402600 RepID=A0A1H9J2U9_9PSEU|nr:TetR/AcrR family transcriptional regulator [Lentzea xinjiangensis]SEQ81102.1 transcriptional regulator, TetR family [Lentzea xinjiangensis]
MTTRDSKDPDLQRSLALLWAGHRRGRRGPRSQLSVERIAQAAVRVADADGIEALSMQRIAAELGYSTMSLYNHVPSKDLLLEVAADIGAGAPPDLGDAEDFRQAVRDWAAALWSGLRRRPWILRVPLAHAPVGPNQLAWLDRLLRPLLVAGLAGGEARAAALHLTAVVRGTAQISIAMSDEHRRDDGIPRTDADLTHLVADLVDPEDYPALTAVHAAETAERRAGPEPVDAEALPFELAFGVDRFLDGIEGWVAAKARRGTQS